MSGDAQPQSQRPLRGAHPVSISAVRGTEFRVAPADGRARTEVLKGAVGVDPGAAPTAVGRRSRPASASASRPAAGSARPSPCCPRPSWNEAGQNQTDKTVHFAVEPQAGAAGLPPAAVARRRLRRPVRRGDEPGPSSADFGRSPTAPISSASPPWTRRPGGLPADYSFDRDLDTLDAGAPADSRERQASQASCSAGARPAAACAATASSCSPGPRRQGADRRPAGPDRAAADPDRPAAGPYSLARERHALQERRGDREAGSAAVAADR
jgi:hypothetical protein